MFLIVHGQIVLLDLNDSEGVGPEAWEGDMTIQLFCPGANGGISCIGVFNSNAKVHYIHYNMLQF